jgi:hypothetical protein
MKKVLLLLIVTFSGLLGARHSSGARDVHIWIRDDTSATEIFTYTPAKCIPYPSNYCTYWTTVNYPFHTMSDSLFQALYNVGNFTGHDFNKRYIP